MSKAGAKSSGVVGKVLKLHRYLSAPCPRRSAESSPYLDCLCGSCSPHLEHDYSAMRYGRYTVAMRAEAGTIW